MKFLALFVIAAYFYSPAEAASLVSCKAQSRSIPSLRIELATGSDGKLSGRYSVGRQEFYSPSWVKQGEITAPPANLPILLATIDQFKFLGIKAADVKKFQGFFIDGSNRWSIELLKLMDQEEQTLGWIAYAFGGPLGCYP